MKNVTGLDLTKLNCGAHGTLGFVTEATIKLAPRPETETTLVMPGLDDARAIEAMTRALGSPFGVSGAAWLQSGMGGDVARTLLRIEGFPEFGQRSRSPPLGAADRVWPDRASSKAKSSAKLWRSVRDAEFVAEPRERAVWRVSVAPSQAAAFVARLGARRSARCYDWGGGLVWVATDATEAAAANLRRALSPARGHATLMRASEALRAQAPVFRAAVRPRAQTGPRRQGELRSRRRAEFRPHVRGRVRLLCKPNSQPRRWPIHIRANSKASFAPACIAASAPRPARPM